MFSYVTSDAIIFAALTTFAIFAIYVLISYLKVRKSSNPFKRNKKANKAYRYIVYMTYINRGSLDIESLEKGKELTDKLEELSAIIPRVRTSLVFYDSLFALILEEHYSELLKCYYKMFAIQLDKVEQNTKTIADKEAIVSSILEVLNSIILEINENS